MKLIRILQIIIGIATVLQGIMMLLLGALGLTTAFSTKSLSASLYVELGAGVLFLIAALFLFVAAAEPRRAYDFTALGLFLVAFLLGIAFHKQIHDLGIQGGASAFIFAVLLYFKYSELKRIEGDL